jgi:hypothetical protein
MRGGNDGGAGDGDDNSNHNDGTMEDQDKAAATLAKEPREPRILIMGSKSFVLKWIGPRLDSWPLLH